MALTTKTMEGQKTMKGEEAGAPEGYEFVSDGEGRIALKKLRDSVKKAVKETKEAVESISDVVEEVKDIVIKKKRKRK